MKAINPLKASFVVGILSALIFVPFLGQVHLFDWDEINFAECAREMIVSGNYLNLQMNFHPFWEKPPLFIWLQVLSMKVFGVNEFSARFPNAVAGIISLVLLYHIGRKQKDHLTGVLWAFCYAASTLPQFYFKSGIIDPWFNLFIFLAFYFFVRFLQEKETRLSLLIQAAGLAALAVLTKGPAAIVILGLCLTVLYVFNKFKPIIKFKNLLILFSTVILFSSIWFIVILAQGKQGIIENFVSYQYHLFHAEDSGHGGPFYYHVVVLLIGCFPSSILALPQLIKKNEASDFARPMQILFWVVLILFSIVQTKIVHYSSLCYFPLTYLAALQLGELIKTKSQNKSWQNGLLLFFTALFVILFAAFPLLGHFKQRIIQSGIIHDQMAIENLKANVVWHLYDWIPAIIMLMACIVSLFFFVKRRPQQAILSILIANLLSTQSAMLLIIPRIEGYTQKAVIDFYESLQDKTCYAESLGYLSYAPYFYARKNPPVMNEKEIRQWMLRGKIDKDAYFVSKISDAENNSKAFPQLQVLEQKNGFVFYHRKADH